MRLLKPAWVSHEGRPIFSIDIHPDGSRFATGGQGDNSGKVVIWNMAPVANEKAEKDENVPKMLCCMDNHQACVNCVRWSHNGKYLASGGDDKIVMIWQTARYGNSGSSTFGSNGKFTNVEQWRVLSILRGHQGDILDVAWSPHDIWLATCSIDNTIVIWNTQKFPEQITILKGHTGMVKGVTWDPIGKYLASQSDDRSVRVWRTLDWQEETTVTKPFKECGGTTHVLRLDWSSDGHYLVSSHAMNNSGPVAQIIERNGWKTSLDFVGHRKAITVVRFNPNIFTKKLKKSSSKAAQYSCCAIGSRDRSISIWLTALKRPLCVIHDLFNNSVLDVSWSQTDMGMLACSWDGTVVYMSFTEAELGRPLCKDEKIALHTKMYGNSLLSHNAAQAAAKGGNQIIESADMLNIQEQKEAEKKAKVKAEREAAKQEDIMVASRVQHSNSASMQSLSKQIETRTKDGRRRITPIFIPYQTDNSCDVPRPFSTTTTPAPGTAAGGPGGPIFSSTKEKTTIGTEKRDKLPPDLHSNKSSSFLSPPPHSQHPSTTTPTSAASGVGAAAIGRSTEEKVVKASQQFENRLHMEPLEKVDKERDTVKLSVKRKLETEHGAEPPKKKDGRGRPRKDRTLETQRQQQTPVHTQQQQQTVIQKETKVVYTNSGLNLPTKAMDKTKTVQISGSSNKNSVVLHVENDVSTGSSASLHRVMCEKAGQQSWEVLLAARITACVGNKQVSVVACEDRSVHLFSTDTGRRMFPALMLDARVHTLRCSGVYLMAITAKGALFVWDISTMRARIKNESLVSIVPSSDVRVHSSLVTEQGLPVVTLSTGATFTYNIDLSCWVSLSSRTDTVHQCSNFKNCMAKSAENNGPLATIQASTKNSGSSQTSSRLYRVTPGVQQVATVSHLEHQVASALALRSSSEHRFWMLTYVRYLVQEGLESKIRGICEDFLGPVFKSKNSKTWEDSILGNKKRDLLREILPLMGSNLSLQRLFTEYKEQLESITT